jgi:hypothetical protein
MVVGRPFANAICVISVFIRIKAHSEKRKVQADLFAYKRIGLIMLINFLIKLSFLIMSLLLFSCASQESIKPFNAADVNPESNSGKSTQKADNRINWSNHKLFRCDRRPI